MDPANYELYSEVSMTTFVDRTAPILKRAEQNPVVTCDNMILEFTEDLDEEAGIHVGAFTVFVNGLTTSNSVCTVRVASRYIVLFLTMPVSLEDTVRLRFMRSEDSCLRAADGATEVAPFTTSVYNQTAEFVVLLEQLSWQDPAIRIRDGDGDGDGDGGVASSFR